MGDTGLLLSQVMQATPEMSDALLHALVTGRLGVNLGMVMENAVAKVVRSRTSSHPRVSRVRET